MGKTYDLETPKHLIQFMSTRFTEDEYFKPNRYFILEGKSHNPINYRKFWYFDAPNMLTYYDDRLYYPGNPDYSSLFKSTGTWPSVYNNHITEYTFKYVNLDDPKDTKSDITLTPIGLTRRNPWKELFGGELEFGSLSNTSINEIYIGNWAVPQAGVKSE